MSVHWTSLSRPGRDRVTLARHFSAGDGRTRIQVPKTLYLESMGSQGLRQILNRPVGARFPGPRISALKRRAILDHASGMESPFLENERDVSTLARSDYPLKMANALKTWSWNFSPLAMPRSGRAGQFRKRAPDRFGRRVVKACSDRAR